MSDTKTVGKLYYLWKFLTIPVSYLQTQELFSACKSGNFKSAKRAVQLGADINKLKYIGRYDNGIPNGAGDECRMYISPLIVAASAASHHQNNQQYYNIISFLIRQPKLDLNRVVMTIEKETHPYAVLREDLSLTQVLASKFRNQARTSHFIFYPEQHYPISDLTAAYIRQELYAVQSMKNKTLSR